MAKLIRDWVVDVPWKQEAMKSLVRQCQDDGERSRLLDCKLLEEVGEFMTAASGDEAIEEAADVLEVMLASLLHRGRRGEVTGTLESVPAARRRKYEARGGFYEGRVFDPS